MDENEKIAEPPGANRDEARFVPTTLLLALLVWVASFVGEVFAILFRVFNLNGAGLPRNGHLILIALMVLSWWTARRAGGDRLQQLKRRGGRFELSGPQMILVTAIVVMAGTVLGITLLKPQ